MKLMHQYNYLLYQNKEEIMKLLGQEFNFYPSDNWTYTLETGTFGKKTILFLFFENDKVSKIEIKKIYGKISTGL
ncbi:hypothetical protein [Chryseobacterium shigense]|uniref:Uncharacterized protein n=1 Tax=Chryseobacterium shigense TaxID=297244 RepID=A0A841NLP1_9FLAO|nr:hypothetical protein [Chryseobacterium shigense]MBB6371695.1 hypothetical protein [Chryseobacterium shigense]